MNVKNVDETVENTALESGTTTQTVAEPDVKDPPKSAWKAYVPRFTEASER